MKIQLGQVRMESSFKLGYTGGEPLNTGIHSNKTLKYLVPCLNKLGKDFMNRLDSVMKVAVGVGDMLITDEVNKFEQHLFILLDIRVASKFFIKFLEWIREQDYYADDYVYHNIQKTPYHMVVVKLPNDVAITKFLEGKYSEMFTQEEIQQLFAKDPDTKSVLIKDHNYKLEFVKKLNYMFDTTIKASEYEGELDLPPKKDEENFI